MAVSPTWIEDEPLTYSPVENIIVPRVRGGISICIMTILFLSKVDSSFSMIGGDEIVVLANSNRRTEIGLLAPGFVEEELDIPLTDEKTKVKTQLFLILK